MATTAPPRRPLASTFPHFLKRPLDFADAAPRSIYAMSPRPSIYAGSSPLQMEQSSSLESAQNNVKYACAACIRGHRTSTCTHKDGSKGPLYPIRSKGRPPTQCEICRKKRKESGRHIRCDCSSKKDATAIASLPSRPDKRLKITSAADEKLRLPALVPFQETGRLPPLSDISLPPIRPSNGYRAGNLALPSIQDQGFDSDSNTSRSSSTLLLSDLMNPCGCKSTGHCNCCRGDRKRRSSPSSSRCDSSQCLCSGTNCASKAKTSLARQQQEAPQPKSLPKDSKPSTVSCCSSKTNKSTSAPSIELLLRAVDMSTAFVPPPCGCGDNCRCARCLSKPASRSEVQLSTSEQTPSSAQLPGVVKASSREGAGCDDCAACDLALERPSGIGAVDSWIEKEKQSPEMTLTQTKDPAIRSSATSSRDVSPSRESRQPSPKSASDLHGGLLTSAKVGGEEDVRAELVLVHPNCPSCVETVRRKGVGVLSSGSTK